MVLTTTIVPVTESQRMAEAMKQIGAEVHYTEYPGVGHPCWNKAYDEPKLFPWLFSKSLPESVHGNNGFQSE